jgi:ribosome-associated toxin RatA of RatAB toxin-antitoxin module
VHSEISIWVDAPLEILFPLVADLASWPARLPHYRYVRILGPEGSGLCAAMSARRGIIPVFWEAVQTPDFAARTVHFRHVRGITRGMEVLWTLTEERGGTRAAIVHELDLRWPVIGRWFAERVIAREFIEPIAGETLRRFKALAEAGAVRQAAATAVVPVAAADVAETPA